MHRLDASPMLQPVKTCVGEGPSRLLALTQVAPGRPCYPPNPQSRLLVQYCMFSRLDLPPAPSVCRGPKPLSPAPLSSQSGSSGTYEPASPSACTSNPKKTPMSIYQEECDKQTQGNHPSRLRGDVVGVLRLDFKAFGTVKVKQLS